MEGYRNDEVVWEGKPSLKGSLSFIGLIGHLLTLFISLLIKWLILKTTEYTITKRSIYIRIGLISKADDEIRLYRVRDLSSNQSLWQRIFKYRKITVISTDHTDRIFILNAVPAELLHTLREEIYQAREMQNIQIIE